MRYCYALELALFAFLTSMIWSQPQAPKVKRLEKQKAERQFSLGAKLGVNISKLSDEADGFGISPEIALRFDYTYNKHFSVMFDPGYLQARLPLNNSAIKIIRADYFKNGLFLAGKYPLSAFVPYLILGAFVNVAFTAEFEDQNAETFDFKQYVNTVAYGLSGGLGAQLKIWRLNAFAEALISRSLNESIKEVSFANLSSTPDLSIQVYVGATYTIWRFNQ